MDVGGTMIKYGRTDNQGKLDFQSTGMLPSNAGAGLDSVLCSLRDAFLSASGPCGIDQVCISIPGPFDFRNGISRMAHKFPSLMGYSLKEYFASLGIRAMFLHDSTAFLLGESRHGGLGDVKNALCIMLGTGLGFSMMRDRRILVDESLSPLLPLWQCPWGQGIAEDAVSTRALQCDYGIPLPIHELAGLARNGDERALHSFRTLGAALSAMIRNLSEHVPCERICLGGQIALASDLMDLQFPFPWYVCEEPRWRPLEGAAVYAGTDCEDTCLNIVPDQAAAQFRKEVWHL